MPTLADLLGLLPQQQITPVAELPPDPMGGSPFRFRGESTGGMMPGVPAVRAQSTAPRANTLEPPAELEQALSNYVQGLITSREAQAVFKQHGWKTDLRRGRYDFEVWSPNGEVHYIQP